MSVWTDAIPYFTRQELACQGTGIIKLDLRFAASLPQLRVAWGPLAPTSVCRSPKHNKAVGGHQNSLHLTENPKHPSEGTMAADLYWSDWEMPRQLAFARLAYSLGWSVGLHNTFIHVDLRAQIGLHQRVFLYGSWDGRFSPDEVL